MTMKPRRISIDLPGAGHSAPIPAACRVGSLLVSSAISGKDPATGKLAETPEEQVVAAFANLDAVLAAGGATLGDLAKLTITLASDDVRAAVNAQWLKRFPDPSDRPARHIHLQALGHGMVIQIEALAAIDS